MDYSFAQSLGPKGVGADSSQFKPTISSFISFTTILSCILVPLPISIPEAKWLFGARRVDPTSLIPPVLGVKPGSYIVLKKNAYTVASLGFLYRLCTQCYPTDDLGVFFRNSIIKNKQALESKCPSTYHITQNFGNAGYSSGITPSALYSRFGNLPSAVKFCMFLIPPLQCKPAVHILSN